MGITQLLLKTRFSIKKPNITATRFVKNEWNTENRLTSDRFTLSTADRPTRVLAPQVWLGMSHPGGAEKFRIMFSFFFVYSKVSFRGKYYLFENYDQVDGREHDSACITTAMDGRKAIPRLSVITVTPSFGTITTGHTLDHFFYRQTVKRRFPFINNFW